MTRQLYIIHRTQHYIGLIEQFDDPELEHKYYYSVSPAPNRWPYKPTLLISGTAPTQADAMDLIDEFLNMRGKWKTNALTTERAQTLFCPDHERQD